MDNTAGTMRPSTQDNSADPWSLVVALGITQIASWGSMFYGFAVLMDPVQSALAASKEAVVGAYCLALLISGLASSYVGRTIDRIGGRAIMSAGSLAAGLLFAWLSRVTSVTELYVVWAGIGLAMAATLYDPAFAVLVRAFRSNYRKAIIALTLFGGLASTVFWPLTQWLTAELGWRDAALTLGAINLLICLPLHVWFVPRGRALPQAAPAAATAPVASPGSATLLRTPNFLVVAAAFTAFSGVMSVFSVHLLSLLMQRGLTPGEAAMIGAIIGPMQVAGRVVEFGFAQRLSAQLTGRVVFALLPLSLLVLLVSGSSLWLCAVFAVLYGISNGVMTIVRGTIPAELFGTAHYGAINGAIATPVLIAKASGPLLASLAFSASGGYMLIMVGTLVVALLAALAFAAIRPTRPQQ